MTKTSSLLKGAKALTSSRASRCTRRVSLQLSKQNRCVPREVDQFHASIQTTHYSLALGQTCTGRERG